MKAKNIIIETGTYNLPVFFTVIVLLCIALAVCYVISKKHKLYAGKKEKNAIPMTKYNENQGTM